MFKCKKRACTKAFENLFTLKSKNKYQLKRSCTLFESFCKSKFSQLCINYCGPHLWNTIWNTYLFILEDITFLFSYCAIKEDKNVS